MLRNQVPGTTPWTLDLGRISLFAQLPILSLDSELSVQVARSISWQKVPIQSAPVPLQSANTMRALLTCGSRLVIHGYCKGFPAGAAAREG
jgi:hypothetical protein